MFLLQRFKKRGGGGILVSSVCLRGASANSAQKTIRERVRKSCVDSKKMMEVAVVPSQTKMKIGVKPVTIQ